MSKTTTIPEAGVLRFREGLYTLVASVCETADHAGDLDLEVGRHGPALLTADS